MYMSTIINMRLIDASQSQMPVVSLERHVEDGLEILEALAYSAGSKAVDGLDARAQGRPVVEGYWADAQRSSNYAG